VKSYPAATMAGGLRVIRPNALPPALTLMSDLHLGAANADHDLIEAELGAAGKAGDRILLNGDVFDMILSKDVKRFSPQVLHPSIRGRTDLVNAAVEMAVELLSPYAKQIDLIGCGNHESAVASHHSVDPTKMLADALGVQYGGYQGFVRYPGRKCDATTPFSLFFWHGAGGGGGLGGQLGEFGSKGQWVEGVDCTWFGHRHCRAVSQVEKFGLHGARLVRRNQFYLRTGGYLVAYGEQDDASIRRDGRRTNYAADSLHTPYGRGGLRVVFAPGARVTIEVTSP